MSARGAIFLDRDNTIVADPGYLHEPRLVRLLPRAADGLRSMSEAGWPLIVVSNQSGIARGMFGPDAYHAVMERMAELLEPHGVRILADYFCSHLPVSSGPCECRKPGTLLFRTAAKGHDLDLAKSWFVGDRWRDIAPGLALGGRGVLIGAPADPADAEEASRRGVSRAPDLTGAARIIGSGGT